MHKYFVGLLIIAIGIVNAEKEKCDITEEIADKCGAQLMIIGNRNFTIPKDDNELLERCGRLKDGIDCYKKYAKNCLESFSSRIMAMITKNGKKMTDQICTTEDSRKEMIEHMQCFENEERMGSVHLCMEKYIVQMERLGDIPSDHRIPSTCCTFHMLRECVKSKGMISCGKKDTIDYIDNIVTEVTGNLITFACGQLKTLEDCDSKMDSTTWQMLKDLVASDNPQEIAAKKKFSSPFAALRDILQKFKN